MTAAGNLLLRHEWKVATILLLLILHLCFFPLIWGNRTLLQSANSVPSILPSGAFEGTPSQPAFFPVNDAGASAWQSEPWFALLHEYWTHGTLPLWNPYQGYGRPFFANQQSQPFYPLTALIALKPTPRTFTWYLLLRLFVAGLCGFGFLRRIVSFTPALAGSVACMLAGYLILFMNQPHISVETLYPAALWAGECLLAKPSLRSANSFAVVILLVFLGGMPESAFLLFVFVYAYLLVRITGESAKRSRQFTYLAVATLVGLALSAFVLLPFLEFASHAFTVHQPGMLRGLEHDAASFSFFGYLIPLGFARPGTIGDLGNYVGIVAAFLMILATASRPPLRRTVLFAWAVVLLVVFKRYGVPIVNSIGMLPLFKLINLTKYDEPMLSFAAVMLIAIGLETLLQSRVSARRQWLALLVLGLILPVAWFSAHLVISHQIAKPLPHMQTYSFAFAAVLLLALAICLRLKKPQWLVAVLVIELIGCYVLPSYRLFVELPRRNRNPYKGAPYISFLKEHAGTDRIFAENGFLSPDWNSAFSLYDIRDLDALYIDRYFPFVKQFFVDPKSFAPDLDDRFTGWPIYQFSTPLEKRLLQLSSVRYISSSAVITTRNKVIEEILSQNANTIPFDKRNSVTLMPNNFIDGDFPETLLEHPPYERLSYKCIVPESDPRFDYSYGVSSAVWDKVGDGVGFTLELRTPAGQIRKIFHNYIDPKHNASDRRWLHGSVDLKEFAGQQVSLLFSTDLGPIGDGSYDWGGWTYLGFGGQQTEPQFRLVYHKDLMVFEYRRPLPRAAVFHHAVIAKDAESAKKYLIDPTFDPFQTVILDETDLTAEARARVESINALPSSQADAAQILSYGPQKVRIEATLDRPGILMLNDSAFPGWEVSIDGQPGVWVSADYLFRGVLLSEGRHTVTYSYLPKSFLWGSFISLVGGLVVAAGGILRNAS